MFHKLLWAPPPQRCQCSGKQAQLHRKTSNSCTRTALERHLAIRTEVVACLTCVFGFNLSLLFLTALVAVKDIFFADRVPLHHRRQPTCKGACLGVCPFHASHSLSVQEAEQGTLRFERWAIVLSTPVNTRTTIRKQTLLSKMNVLRGPLPFLL